MELKPNTDEGAENKRAHEGGTLTMSQKPVLFRPSRTVLTYPSEAFQEKLLCDGLTLNLGDACVYSCSFCYVEAQMKKLTYQLLRDHNKEHGGNRSHEDVIIRRRGAKGETALEILSNQLAGRVKCWPMISLMSRKSQKCSSGWILGECRPEKLRLWLTLKSLMDGPDGITSISKDGTIQLLPNTPPSMRIRRAPHRIPIDFRSISDRDHLICRMGKARRT